MNKSLLSKCGLTKNVFFMGLVSFFNDMSTEMMYPILSIFLTTTLGASPAAIGFILGTAKATEHIFLVLFGWLSDVLATRKPFVVFGYILSSLSKGLIGFAGSWQSVLFFFFFDRLGKSVRTAPRDVLIVSGTAQNTRGRIFGFHRAADTFGAVAGPLVTMAYLAFIKNNLRPIFFLTVIPATIAVILLICCVHECLEVEQATKRNQSQNINGALGKDYYLFLLVSMLFYLGSSVESFFILRAYNLGFAVSTTVFLYMISNVIYACSSYPMGIVADMLGHKKVLISGFLLFSGVSFAFGYTQNPVTITVLFALYGLYMALTEGVVRAHISHLVPIQHLGLAFGIFSTAVGFCMFIGVFGSGFLWTQSNAQMPFLIGGFCAASAAILLLMFARCGLLKR